MNFAIGDGNETLIVCICCPCLCLDTHAILQGCDNYDDFLTRLQKRLRTQKLPKLRNEREDVVFAMPDGVKLTAKEMSVYAIH